MERSMWDAGTGGEAKEGYRVLARKYRPRDFSDLIGQQPLVRTLTNAFETGRIAQAYMLTGVRGVGKTTTARILARALNYETETVHEPTIDLTVAGEHCAAIMEGHHVDVVEMDAASHTGIDDIREIIEQVRYRPVSARYKVYIIDEVHMLSTQAFNGLLKTLEEPPAHVKFIFATTEIRKVPITVLSRCQRFDLRRIHAGVLVEHFGRIAAAEGIEADDLSLSMIARAAEGSVRDGLSLMDQAIAHGGGRIEAEAVRSMLGLADRSRIIELFEHVAKGDVAAVLKEFREQYDVGANPPVVLTDLADFTHLVTRLKFVREAADDPSLTETERERGTAFAETLSVPTLSRLWQMLLKGIAETESSNRPYAAAEMVLIRLAHAAHLPAPEDLARKLGSSASPVQGGNGSERAQNGTDAAAQAVRSETSIAGRSDTAPAPSASNVRQAPQMTAVSPSPDRPMMAARGNGSSAERAVPEPAMEAAPEPEPEPAPQPESRPSEATGRAVASLHDVVALATEHRDIKLKTLVRTCVRPVRIEPGRIEIALTPDAPKSLPGDLGVALEKWTGRRFVVMLSREEGGPTIAGAEAEARETLVRDAKADPDVAAILERFPGARITDVRIRTDEEDIDLELDAPPPDDGEEPDED